MTETDTAIAAIIAALAILSLADYLIVSGCVWAAAKIFRYRRKDKKIPAQIAAYSLKVGLIVAVPFALAIYISAPSLQDILGKGIRLLLPLGLVFIIKTAVIFQKIKDLYLENLKKTAYGFLTAAYLMIVAWVFALLLFSMMLAACSVLAAIMGLYAQSDNWQLTGWWDVQPIGSGSYNASGSSFSVKFMNRMGEQIKIDAAEVLDLNSEAECNVTSPATGETVDVNGTFALNAACPGNTPAGSPYEFVLEIHYSPENNSTEPLFENGYFSGNASE